MVTRIERALYRAYYGPRRRIFRAALRRFPCGRSRIWFGRLRGSRIRSDDLACRLGIYELHVQELLCRQVKTGHVVYDLGANLGFHTLLASRLVGETGEVVAFEPLPENIRNMEAFLRMNRCRNVRVRREAVCSRAGPRKFVLGESCAEARLSNGEGAWVDVKGTTLDDVIAGTRWPDLVLMDIEGAEVEALGGAGHLLSSARQCRWIIETHSPAALEAVTQRLTGKGLVVRVVPHLVPRITGFPVHILACPAGRSRTL
jgi:FkbM family methyltransferase